MLTATVLAGACAVLACNGTSSEPTSSSEEEALRDPSKSIARGHYLVTHLLLCGNCHNSTVDGGAPLSGGKAFTVPQADGGAGAVYAANLTPDNATGLGTWSATQIANAILHGVDNEGAPLHPTMPYWIFGNLERSDALAIATYLKSLPPTSNAVPERTVTVAAPTPTLDRSMVPRPMGATAKQEMLAWRGKYLAQVACIDCHTQRDGGSPDLTMAFAGGRAFGPKVKSSNLTPDRTGLSGWTTEQIVDTLKTGHKEGDDAGALLCSPMPSGPATVGGLTDVDLNDIATYLAALPPVQNGPFEADGGCR
jgi:mono/diheme cytochrome c family protein